MSIAKARTLDTLRERERESYSLKNKKRIEVMSNGIA